MFSEYFNGNLMVGFIISVIVVMSYSNFAENQQISLIYLMIFGLAFFRITTINKCALLLFLSTFAFLEYLTTDKGKLELIRSFWLKALDYMYLMLFQFHILYFLLSLFFLSKSFFAIGNFRRIYIIISVLLMLICEHRTITQPFKIKTITDILRPFIKRPYYSFKCTQDAKRRYEMLCRFEDQTYFSRTRSYSCFTTEYLKAYGMKRLFRKLYAGIFGRKTARANRYSLIKLLLNRGYSTPEMQLIRTIGIQRGYNKYKFHRKCFEAFYARIFFSSFRKYQVDNSGPTLRFFREYILDIYFKNVLTRINGHRFSELCNAFENADDVASWPLEGVFIACLGLSFRQVNDKNLSLYSKIIEEFNLDIEKIYTYADLIDEGHLIPCAVG